MKLKIKTESIWTIFICIGIIGNLALNAIYNKGYGNIVFYNVLLWIFLMIGSLITNYRIIDTRLSKIIFFGIVCGLIGNLHGTLLVDNGISSLDNMIINFLIMIAFIAFKEKISKYSLNMIMRTLVICGIIVSLYAMITKPETFISVLKGLDIANNSWAYTSFLGQRNIFAGYCFISSIGALYLLVNEKRISNKVLYFAVLLLFGIQIFITNSRTALISYVVLILSYIYLSKGRKTRFLLIFVAIIGSIILFQNNTFNNTLTRFFIHTTSSGIDSGIIRLDMWKGAIKYSFEKIGLMCGFGIYPISVILLDKFGYASTHNAYIDAILTGGIVYISIIIYIYYYSYKKIKLCSDRKYSIFMISALAAFILYNINEAGMAIFTQNYFSITSTIIFILIPMEYDGENTYDNRKKIRMKIRS